MPKQYAREFRRAACARLVAGEKVSSLSTELAVSEATLYLWKRQALIDAGRAEGIKSYEADELAQAHRTIAELEAELEAVKAARVHLSVPAHRWRDSATQRANGLKTHRLRPRPRLVVLSRRRRRQRAVPRLSPEKLAQSCSARSCHGSGMPLSS